MTLSHEKETAPKMKRRSTRRHWGFLLRLFASVVLLCFLFTRQADLREALRILKTARFDYLLLGFSAFAVGEFLTVIKWRFLLGPGAKHASLLMLSRAMLVGEFYSVFLPSSVGGDIARIAMTSKIAGSASNATSAALMQRNTGMGALLILAIVAATFQPVKLNAFSGTLMVLDDLRNWFLIIALAYGLINVALLSETVYRLVWKRKMERPVRSGLLRTILDFADRFHFSTHQLRGRFLLALALSLITQFLDCVMGWCAARAIGADISLLHACVFVPTATLAALLPLSLNGIGLREMTYVKVTAAASLTPEQAVAISTIHFACIILLALIGGLWHLLQPTVAEVGTTQPPGNGTIQ